MSAEMREEGRQDLLERRIAAVESRLGSLADRIEAGLPANRVCLICFSGDWDRLFAALTIAHGALALGQEVHLFFTFWGVSALRGDGDEECQEPPPDLSRRLLQRMLPRGPLGAKLSRMHFLGLGRSMMKRLMRRHGVDDVDVLLREVRELGGKVHLCETSALLLGVRKEDLANPEGIDRCGVATFMSLALRSRLVLFV